VLVSAPVLEEMQREADDEADSARRLSIVDFMRARLAAEKARSSQATHTAGRPVDEHNGEERRAGERVLRYDSLNEQLAMLSLSRAVKLKQWRRAGRLALGWALNHACFTVLLLLFVTYGCRFEAESELTKQQSQELLLYSWAWSIMQRFVINEPVIIFIGVLLPMIFATECCANLCTESFNNLLGVAVAVCITFLKRLRR